MLDLLAYIALVITATGLPLGLWSHPRHRRRHRADRQLLALIHHTDRKANR